MPLELIGALKTFQDLHLSDLSKDAPCTQLENKIQVSWIPFSLFQGHQRQIMCIEQA